MALPLISSVPEDQQDWDGWTNNHYCNHVALAASLQDQMGVQTQIFPILSLDRDTVQQWIFWHQVMHNQLNEALGTQGTDLTGLDWRDPDQLETWIYQNAQEHIVLCGKLGVG